MVSISVVVATYRRDALLTKALESLSAQSFRDFEIIVVDDNTESAWNEKVAEAARQFRDRHPELPLRLLMNSGTHGSAGARNEGIRAAEGSYITFLDDDDLYLPEKLEHQYKAMLESDADYSLTDLILYDEEDRPVDRRLRPFVKDDDSPEKLTELHMLHHLTGTDAIMMRKDYLFKIGLFGCVDIGDEFYLMQNAISAGGKFCYLHRCDVKAYVHPPADGLSAGKQKIQGENHLYRFKKTYFPRFSASVRRRIKMRHYAVLSYTYLRMRKPGKAFRSAFLSAGASPLGLLRLLMERKV